MVEAKCSAYLQPWNYKTLSKLIFDIALKKARHAAKVVRSPG